MPCPTTQEGAHVPGTPHCTNPERSRPGFQLVNGGICEINVCTVARVRSSAQPPPRLVASSLAVAAPAAAQQASAADIDRMMAVIEAQQAQIDAMRAELTR